jgi:UDP-glucose 4-epimerase
MGQGFIATAMASAIQGRPLTIFGDHGAIRDYIHVTDLASGIVAAMQDGELGQTYNLGTGIGLSTMQILQHITPLLKQRGYRLEIVKKGARPFDVCANVLDSTALRKKTEWAPIIEFDNGLARMLDSQMELTIRNADYEM